MWIPRFMLGVAFVSAACTNAVGAAPMAAKRDVVNALTERVTRLSGLEVQFETNVYRFDADLDILDRRNWRPLRLNNGGCVDFSGTARLLAPSSFWLELSFECPGGPAETSRYGWHADEFRILGGLATGDLAGSITNPYQYVSHLGGEHVLQALEYRTFDYQMTLAEFVAGHDPNDSGDLRDGSMWFSGYVKYDTGLATRVDIALDPDRDYIPTTLDVVVTYYATRIRNAYRLLESAEVDNFAIPQRAVYAVYHSHPELKGQTTTTEWRMVSAQRSADITEDTISVTFPPSTAVTDYINDEHWTVGADGQRTEVIEVSAAIRESTRAGIEGLRAAEELRASRRSVFPYIAGGAVTITVVVLLLQWRRHAGA